MLKIVVPCILLGKEEDGNMKKKKKKKKKFSQLIALHKMFFQSKNIDIFLISPEKQSLWYSLETPTTYVSLEK